MADIGLDWQDYEGSMKIANNDLAVDEGLQTAILVSLFTDRQADASDILPEGESYRRGWWGDTLPDVQGDKIGSKLWLLRREKQLPEVLRRAEQYAREALQWLIDDKVATGVTVVATNPSMGVMHLQINITRPAGSAITFRYDYNWAAQALQGA